jgi:hypothetical protein
MSKRAWAIATTWVAVLANIATALSLLLAAYQLRLTVNEQRITRTAEILKQGQDLDRRFHAGTADAREVISFRYYLYTLSTNDMIVADLAGPAEQSLDEFIRADPRARDYWSKVDKKRFSAAFVGHVDQMTKVRAP